LKRREYPDILRRILSTLKSRAGCSLEELVPTLPRNYFFVDVNPNYLVFESITTLVNWGLVEAFLDGKPISAADMEQSNRWKWVEGVVFYISPNALQIEQELDIALDRSPTAILGESRGGPQHDGLDVFVLMPFSDDLQPIYSDHIRAVTASLDLRCARADDFFTTGSVMADIWAAINSAAVIVADCTNRNPNVFYEIGLAHARGKDTVLITQSLDDIPFDLRHLRVIPYQFNPHGIKRFEHALRRALLALQPTTWPSQIAAAREREEAVANARAQERFAAWRLRLVSLLFQHPARTAASFSELERLDNVGIAEPIGTDTGIEYGGPRSRPDFAVAATSCRRPTLGFTAARGTKPLNRGPLDGGADHDHSKPADQVHRMRRHRQVASI
jgi:hypothetical protein